MAEGFLEKLRAEDAKLGACRGCYGTGRAAGGSLVWVPHSTCMHCKGTGREPREANR